MFRLSRWLCHGNIQFFALIQHVVPLCLQWPLAQLFDAAWESNLGQCSVYLFWFLWFLSIKKINISKYISNATWTPVHNDGISKAKGGKYHCTIDLLFDLFGLVCFANKNKNRQLSYSWFQRGQTGSQWYSNTSPFSIPWRKLLLGPGKCNNKMKKKSY